MALLLTTSLTKSTLQSERFTVRPHNQGRAFTKE